jgi:hypothetical protein
MTPGGMREQLPKLCAEITATKRAPTLESR